MSVLTPAELATYLVLVEDTVPMQLAIDKAEAAAASWIGIDTFEESAGEEAVLVKGMAGTILPVGRNEALLVDVTAMVIDNSAADLTKMSVHWWDIGYRDGFGQGAEVAITFDKGFLTSAAMPDPMRLALLQSARWFLDDEDYGSKGRGAPMSERFGDWAAAWADAGLMGDPIPRHAQRDLLQYRRPRL